MKKCLEVLFSGMVQGVGFRYTTRRLSARFSVCGYVRNLPDGKVEVVAEGEESELLGFFNAIRDSSLASCIRDVNVRWTSPTGQFDSFDISL